MRASGLDVISVAAPDDDDDDATLGTARYTLRRR